MRGSLKFDGSDYGRLAGLDYVDQFRLLYGNRRHANGDFCEKENVIKNDAQRRARKCYKSHRLNLHSALKQSVLYFLARPLLMGDKRAGGIEAK